MTNTTFLFKILGIYANYINIRESSSGLLQIITDCLTITWQLKKKNYTYFEKEYFENCPSLMKEKVNFNAIALPDNTC